MGIYLHSPNRLTLGYRHCQPQRQPGFSDLGRTSQNVQALRDQRVHHEVQRLDRLTHQGRTVNRFQICHEDHSLLVLPKKGLTIMWAFKMFFQDDGEFFEYDPFGFQGAAGTEKALPFLESLLSFLELDPTDWKPLVQQASSYLGQFTSTGDAA